jgi:tubulin-specific chaperone C
MEERFLKGRQEREEQRQQRSKEGEAASTLRMQYEAEAEQLEAEVAQLLTGGNISGSQQRIDALRKLVQDTSNSIVLTAHDMAKANAILARLQQQVDDAKGAQAGLKKFKFSSRLKTKAASGPGPSSKSPTTASEAESTPASSAKPVNAAAPSAAARGSSGASFGNTYGPSSGTDLFIADSKGVFINGCMNCRVFCLPIAGSVFLSNCANCCVYVACQQLRLKDCRDTDLFVWCASTPIIESCSRMRFGPYSCWDGLLNSAASNGATHATHAEWVRCVGEISATAQTEHNYENVDDFQWVRKTASPHWRVMTEAEQTHSSTPFGPATPPNSAA